MKIKRLSDGILFQFLMVGSLSFSHIHDVVAAHGQAGWKSWLYPLSVDLLTVAAYRRILAAHRVKASSGLAWCSFLLGLAASLAANVVDSWTAAATGRVLAVAIGVWPAVALLVCTLLGHDQTAPALPSATPAPVPAPIPAAAAIAPQPSPVVAAQVPEPVIPAAPASTPDLPPIAPPLLAWARGIAEQHHKTTGSPITPDALATRLRIAPALAEAVHGHLTAQTAGA